jgi:catechol 2,3-dioxygenase-like lactoylglutathione lyase family enzyme
LLVNANKELRLACSMVSVRRIVSNLAATPATKEAACAFYANLFDLEVVMDHGWIATLENTASEAGAPVQVSIATEGGSGTSVPDLSIEVDDVDEVLRRAEEQQVPIEYGPVTEPWGIRRFYVRDPLNRLVNVSMHVAEAVSSTDE